METSDNNNLLNIHENLNKINKTLMSIDSELKSLRKDMSGHFTKKPVSQRKVRFIDQPVGDKKTLAEVRVLGMIDVETIGLPDYAIFAKGYNMEPDILDGSLILVRPTALNWNNDDLCLVYLRDSNEWIVRMIRCDSTRTRVRLIGPRNEKEYLMKNIIVHGVVEDCVNDPESVLNMIYTMKFQNSSGNSGIITL